MIPKINVLAACYQGYQITMNKSNQDPQDVFASFKQDFRGQPNFSTNSNKNLLTPTSINQQKSPRTKSQDKKRMKLIDYIYMKNTAKKNQHSSKIQKSSAPGLSSNELRKSRIKEGKQKAIRSMVDELVSELKDMSSKALAMADLANQNLTFTGNTEDIAKLCNIRRILKDSIFPSMGEVQKMMGIQNDTLLKNSKRQIQKEEDEEFNNRIKRLESLGVQRLQNESDDLKHVLSVNNLTIKHDHSRKQINL